VPEPAYSENEYQKSCSPLSERSKENENDMNWSKLSPLNMLPPLGLRNPFIARRIVNKKEPRMKAINGVGRHLILILSGNRGIDLSVYILSVVFIFEISIFSCGKSWKMLTC
jgi:hypothetical protein